MERTYKLIASLALIATVSTMVGCDAKGLTNAANNFANSETGKALIHQAALALKTIDENGVDLQYTDDQVLKVTVGGKEVKPTFDANGNLLVDGLTPGQENNVLVTLKDGQQITVPVRPEEADFKNGGKPKFEAFLMPGHEDNKLYGEVRRQGEGGKFQDVFKGKAVKVELNRTALTNENLRRVYIGKYQVPRQSVFVENGNLMLHPSNLWVIKQAGGAPQGGQQQPTGGMQQGGMQPPPGGQQMPGGQPPQQPPMFSVMQAPPPPGGTQTGGMQPPPPGGMQQTGTMQPPPGGMQQPQMGGMQQGTPPTVTFHLLVEPANGNFRAFAFKVERAPGPPPLDANGQVPVFVADKPPSIGATQIKDIKEIEVKDIASFEAQTVQSQAGKFLPPPPPAGQRPPSGGQQPPAGGQQPQQPPR